MMEGIFHFFFFLPQKGGETYHEILLGGLLSSGSWLNKQAAELSNQQIPWPLLGTSEFIFILSMS